MTNPIDPKRLKAVLKAIDPYKMAPPSTELYVYGVPIVRKVLEADDQWRANHQVMLDSSTGITPSANPTSGGKVEQDAAGEEREPALPEGFKFISDDGKWCEFQDRPNNIVCYPWSELSKYEAVCRWMRHRQRLQDKRDHPEVTEEMLSAAWRMYEERSKIGFGGAKFNSITMEKCIAAALEARKP